MDAMDTQQQVLLQLQGILKEIVSTVCNVVVTETQELLELEIAGPSRLWVRKWISRRSIRGASAQLFKELAAEDTTEYYYALRLTEESFNTLLDFVRPAIQKSDTFMRLALPAKVKLHAILYLLANGISLRVLQHFFRVPKSTTCLMISEVCSAIYNALRDYIKVPGEEEWNRIEQGFRNSWNFPGCSGAIDGKHVAIKAPPHAGSYYYNYKKTNSLVLMAVADDDYCFSYIDVGCNGRVSDGGVFSHCDLSHALENSLLPDGHVLVGDSAFPLKTYMMKPYGGNQLTFKQKIYNYRLSRARRIIENVFGILVSRYRIFEKPLPYIPDKVEIIVKACCAMHNWARKTKIPVHITTLDVEDTENGSIIPGSWRDVPMDGFLPLHMTMQNRSSRNAQEIRNSYADYFVGEGAVSWQSRMVN